jgi:uncharacterized repeat protein (TIGR01451 family)
VPAVWLLGMSDALAQQGKTGAGNITGAGTIVNEYTNLTADVAAGATSITVASNTLNANNRFAAALAPGDLVMLVQMQGATINTTATTSAYGAITSYNNAGKNELLEVRSVSGTGTINFYCGTNNAYTASGRTQVVRIPRYTTLTLAANTSLTAPAWNGTVGGIVAVEAQGDVTLGTNAVINANGLGFRGGVVHNVSTNPSAGANYASTSNAYGGEKGEGIAGYQADYDNLTGRYGRGAAANGGGGGNTHNAGGGGGANVGTGTWTGTGNPATGFNNAWNQESANFAASTSSGGGRGGYTYSANNQDAGTTGPGNTAWAGDNRQNLGGLGGRPLVTTGGLLFLGGGGGAGDSNDNTGTSGGNGGGLIYMLVGGNIVNAANATGTAIRANGNTAGTSANDAPGGGGGGGAVVLNVAGTIASVAISATGGVGGSQNLNTAEAEGPGGGGGGGYIVYTAASTTAPATGTTVGAAGGTTNSPSLTEFIPNGATAGGAGIIAQVTYAAQCAVVADVAAAFTTAPATATAGTSVSYTVQFANNGPDVANGVTRTVTIPANAASSVTAPNATSVTGNQASGWTITYPGGTVATGTTSYTFSLVPAASGGSFGLTAATTTTTNQGTNPTADSDTRTLTINATVTGVVFEDVNYGGGSGRPATASGAVGRANATVEFYTNAGAYVGATTTGTNGAYSYNLPAAGTYTVRVVNSTVSSSRTGYVAGLLPVQTYNGTTTAVGGVNPVLTDAAANNGSQSLTALSSGTTTPQSLASVTAASGITTGPDFGFNFDVVVNTSDAGQGSLRQFITNSNALGGETSLAQAGSNAAGLLPASTETSIFMIPDGAAHPGLLASGNGGPGSQLNGSGVAVITPVTVLPTITSPRTSIDGTTQSSNIGNTNGGTLGSGGTVGTGNTALGTVNRPEVQLVGNRNFDGVVVGATNAVVRGLSLYGFNHDITVNTDITAFLIEQNIIGTSATSFTDPGVNVRTLNEGVLLNGADNGTVRNNLIGYNGGMGVWVLANGNNGSNGNTIAGNEIRGNAQESKPAPEGLVFDGLELQGNSTNNTVSGNLIAANFGHGIDSFGNGIGGNTVSGNTISGNGVGVTNGTGEEGSGLRIFGATNPTIISGNVLSGNNGSGVLVSGSANNITISQNSTFGNARLGIDLISETGAPVFYNGNTGATSNVTINDSGDGDTGGNGLLNFPVITRATLTANGLLVQGFARPGSTIELFTADNTPNSVAANVGFGQGRTYLGTFTEGSTTGTSPDTDGSTGTYGPAAINGLTQGTDNTSAFSFLIPLTGNFAGLAAGATLTSTATLANSTSEFSGNATLAAISGFVYEDVNYGGGAGRPRSANGTVGRPGATVELYNGTTLVSTTTTDANGQYTFGTTPGTYTVRVVNSTVSSSRTGYVAGLLPVQTYNGTTTAVGGVNPVLADAAANNGSQSLTALNSGTATAQSLATITTTSAAATGPDFGFNFDVVVNTNNAGQGSLRQFITNANALGGETSLAQAGSNAAGLLPASTETSIFMIPDGAAHPGLLASGNGGPASQLNGSGVAVITPATVLPAITGTLTRIDGTTQSSNIGNTNGGTLGIGGTVGTGNTALGTVNRPEVQLVGSTATAIGLDLANTATNSTIAGLAIYGFGNATDDDNNANIRVAANNTTITGNVVGNSATNFTTNSPVATNADNIRIDGGTGVQVTGNLIGFANGKGVAIDPVVTGTTVSGNEIRSNAQTVVYLDGVDIQGSNATVTNNLLINNNGQGVDSYLSAGGNTIAGNTISGNGVGNNETAGVRIYGANNTLRNNVVSNNYGAGITVVFDASNTTISQNSIFGNGTITGVGGVAATGQVGIDLLSNADDEGKGTSPFVTLNDNGDADTGGNGLLNFPVLTTANVSGTSLVVTGYARPGSLVELFLATPPATGPATSRSFGQGSSFLTSRTEGNTTDDSNTGTGTYSGTINGVNQGTDNTNLFTFTVPLSSLTAAQRTALLSGNAVLTSTATLANATSEFSGNLALPITDVTVALTGPQTVTPGQPTGTYTVTFTNEGPVAASNVTRTVTLPANVNPTTVVLPAGATLTGSVIDFGTVTTLNSGVSNSFSFSFTPAATATGTVAIVSNIGTATSQGNNLAPDASTINATVAPAADVLVTLAATTGSVAAGTPRTAGTPPTFTATFNNNGPTTAAGVVAAVQLPKNLSNVTATNGGVYDANTGIVSYAGLTSIASGTPTTSVITFDAPAAGPIAASATIATTTNEAGRTTNNQASATMAVVPAFDLLTTITGPASAVAGDLVTLNVTTTNNGPSSATNAVQTVQIGQGLSNVYVSNGGVYNATNATQTIVSNGVSYSVPAGAVVFPTLASVATGQTVANSISFPMPNATITPTASVTPNTASSASTAGDTNTGNNAANLNAGATGTTAASVTVATPAAGTANAYTTISTSAATTTVGTPVTLTVTTGNNGPNSATGVTQTVQLMPGFTTGTLQVNGTTGTPSGNTITFGTGGPTYDITTGLVVFPTLTNGANGSATGTSVTNTIRLTPSAAVAGASVATTGNNGQLLAMATVRTTNADPVAADNVASVGVTVAPSSDLVATLTGPAAASAGQSVTYTASFVNNGPLAASSVVETAQLPAGLSAVTITDANGNAVSSAAYNATTGLVTFPALTSDASGAAQVFKLTFVAPAQSFTPRSSISSTSTESNPTNNSASVVDANGNVGTTVTPAADLATLVSGPATAVVGNAVTYTVTTTNNGPASAASAATTLQLPAGFDATTLRVNGTTGVLSGTTITYTFTSGATATYSTTSGLVTFPTVATLANGASVSNYVTFVMPNVAGGQVAGVASASASGNTDPTAANNTASVATSIAPTTTTSADLVATLSAASGTVAPGATVTYTATYSNIGTAPGVNVVPTLQLLPGLTATTLPSVGGSAGTLANGVITFPNNATYSQQTGVLTFPTIASQVTGTTGNVSYNVQVVAPANGPLLATAATTSSTSEPNTAAAQNNNVQSASVSITPSFNEVTSVSGPATAVAGTSQTYTVTTTNNGPSITSNATTQTVTVPAGQTPTNITGGGVYSSGSNNITWTIPAGQSAGVNGAVANSFTIVQPTTATTFTAAVTVTGESNSGDNSSVLTTTPTNFAPLAYAVVNTLQNPQSNDAAGQATGLPISPLNASDPENAFATQKYTIVAVPSAAQGTLYYNNAGTYTAVAANQTLTDAQAQTLRFKAATTYAGNASFTYLTTDAAGNTSPVVSYTIPVATDVEAAAYTLTAVKGGSNPYVAGDVIAYTTDANGAVYNANGGTPSVYKTTTNDGTLLPQATNGIAAATEVANSITGPGTTSSTTLAQIGLAVDATGRLVIDAAPNKTKLKAGSYTVQIATIDVNGGQTTRTVSFTIPANPLPVVLSAFTASAVGNRDAQLDWTTASEVNSAYFDIERSFDGTSFTKVGQLAAKGTSSSSTPYALLDKGVASLATTGTVYYRLKQVDLDGKAAYSPVRTVSFTKAAVASLSLFPNPAQTTTSLDLRQLPAGGSYQVSLLDATGRVVRTLTLGGGQLQSLEVSSLATGSYIVLVTGTQPDGSALRQALRLTKE